jgi:hypothetical protein
LAHVTKREDSRQSSVKEWISPVGLTQVEAVERELKGQKTL